MLKKEFKRLTALSMAFVLSFSSFMLPEGMTERVYAVDPNGGYEGSSHHLMNDSWVTTLNEWQYNISTETENGNVVNAVHLVKYEGQKTDIIIPVTMADGEGVEYKVYLADMGAAETWNEGYVAQPANNLKSIIVMDGVVADDSVYMASGHGIFSFCNNLKTLDIAGLDTSYLSSSGYDYMFTQCSSLRTIYASEDFLPQAGAFRGEYMFSGCSMIEGGAGTRPNFYSVNSDINYAHIDGGEDDPGYFTAKPYTTKITDWGHVEFKGENSDMIWISDYIGSNKDIHIPYAMTIKEEDHIEISEGSGNSGIYASGTFRVVFFGMGAGDTLMGDESNANAANAVTSISFDKGVIIGQDMGNGDTPPGQPAVYSGHGIFQYCNSLTKIDLTGVDVSDVSDMSGMFMGCSSITVLDLSGFDTAHVKQMRSMFDSCSQLETIFVSDLFTTDGLVEADDNGCYMFWGCEQIKSQTSSLPYYNSGDVDATFARFDEPPYVKGYFTRKWYETVLEDWEYEVGYDSFTGQNNYILTKYLGTYAEEAEYILIPYTLTCNDGSMYSGMSRSAVLKSMGADDSGQTPASKLKGIKADYGVTSAEDASGMFANCSNLRLLEIEQLNTSATTDMSDMFSDCSRLERLDRIYNMDTSKVTDMRGMFKGCSSLTTLDFSNPSSSINDRFVTSGVTDMSSMFEGCSGLAGLNVTAFDTSGVTNMNRMFYGCSSLTSLELRSFDTAMVTDMSYMLAGCNNLEMITGSSAFSTESVANDENMFTGSTNIVGGKGTEYNADHIDSRYARIDKGNEEPGYFYDDWYVTTAADWSKETDNVNNTVTLKSYNGSASSGQVNIIIPATMMIEDKEYNVVLNGIGTSKKLEAVIVEDGVVAGSGAGKLFQYNRYIKKVDLVGLDTSQISDMSQMFYQCDSLVEADLHGINTSNVTDVSDMFRYSGNLKRLVLCGFDLSNATGFDTMLNLTTPSDNKLIYLDVTGWKLPERNADISGLFDNLSKLTSIDLSGWENTSAITDMSELFSSCSSLTSIDLSEFDTSHVTNMNKLFSGCSKLAEIKTGIFDTSKVTDMGGMFSGCHALKASRVPHFDTSKSTDFSGMFSSCNGFDRLDLEWMDTSSATDMQNMFKYCEYLVSLDISSFNTANVTTITGMFSGCRKLSAIYVSDAFTTESLTNQNNTVFSDCNKLKGGKGTEYKNSQYSAIYARIDGGEVAPGYFTDIADAYFTTTLDDWDYELNKTKGEVTLYNFKNNPFSNISGMVIPKTVQLKEGNGIRTYNILLKAMGAADMSAAGAVEKPANKLTSIKLEEGVKIVDVPIDPDQEEYMDGYVKSNYYKNTFTYCNNLVSLDISGADISQKTLMRRFFMGCTSLENLTASWTSENTAGVTDMNRMFADCCSLKSIDLTGFNSSNATDMGVLFGGCSALEAIDVSGLDTSKAEDMGSFFYNCSSLTEIDISMLDTSSATRMSNMFNGCSNLTTLTTDWAGANTSNVTTINRMFSDCVKLTSIDLTGFNTSSLTNTGALFNGCKALEFINLSGFDTSNVTDFGSMFYGCESLMNLDLSNFDTSKGVMFVDCKKLEELDLSSFTTEAAELTSNIFSGCSKLKTIYVTSGFQVLEGSTGVFTGCSLLTGGKGTTFTSTNTNYEYARIDQGPESDAPGYFTDVQDKEYTTKAGDWEYELGSANDVILKKYIGDRVRITIPAKMKIGGVDKTVKFMSMGSTDLYPEGAVASAGNNVISISFENGVIAVDTPIDEEKEAAGLDYYCNCFTFCYELTDLDLTGLDFSQLTNMSKFFMDCKKLKNITVDWSQKDLSKVTDIKRMFRNCESLVSIDLSGFDAGNATDMYALFEKCTGLEDIDLTGFDTSSAVNMSYMFNKCEKLTELDLGSFDTSNVETMERMFEYCSALTTVDISSFDFSSATNMKFMFNYCTSLKSIGDVSFNCTNVNMGAIFQRCESLENIKFDDFNITGSYDFGYIFFGCKNLKTVKIDFNSTSSGVGYMESLFDGCSKLESIEFIDVALVEKR